MPGPYGIPTTLPGLHGKCAAPATNEASLWRSEAVPSADCRSVAKATQPAVIPERPG
jgi:hypothetical protein